MFKRLSSKREGRISSSGASHEDFTAYQHARPNKSSLAPTTVTPCTQEFDVGLVQHVCSTTGCRSIVVPCSACRRANAWRRTFTWPAAGMGGRPGSGQLKMSLVGSSLTGRTLCGDTQHGVILRRPHCSVRHRMRTGSTLSRRQAKGDVSSWFWAPAAS